MKKAFWFSLVLVFVAGIFWLTPTPPKKETTPLQTVKIDFEGAVEVIIELYAPPHGSHVAGVIGPQKSGAGVVGIAPDVWRPTSNSTQQVTLATYNIFSCEGQSDSMRVASVAEAAWFAVNILRVDILYLPRVETIINNELENILMSAKEKAMFIANTEQSCDEIFDNITSQKKEMKCVDDGSKMVIGCIE